MLTMLFILTFIVVLICGIIGFTKHKTLFVIIGVLGLIVLVIIGFGSGFRFLFNS